MSFNSINRPFNLIKDQEDRMKVKVEMKITVLEGEEEGRIFTEKTIVDTKSEYTEYGIIESLIMKWKYIHKEMTND